jgi:phage terminase large subunit GpA-like protein
MAWHSPEYKRYLRSNAWAIRKNAYYRRFNRQCAACGSWKRIQLHHVSYENLGHEPDQGLVPLCRADHVNAHRAHQSMRFKDLRAATDEIVKIGRRRRARRKTLSDFVRWLLHGF